MDKTRQERYNMIYGNTVRKIEDSAQPVRKQPAKKVRSRKTIQTSPKTRQNQKRAVSIDFAIASFFYLSQRAQYLKQKTVLSNSKTELNTLQVENEDLNLEIEQSIKFDTIEAAAKKYGMSKPDTKHILRYQSQDAQYVHQYGKIPKAD